MYLNIISEKCCVLNFKFLKETSMHFISFYLRSRRCEKVQLFNFPVFGHRDEMRVKIADPIPLEPVAEDIRVR